MESVWRFVPERTATHKHTNTHASAPFACLLSLVSAAILSIPLKKKKKKTPAKSII